MWHLSLVATWLLAAASLPTPQPHSASQLFLDSLLAGLHDAHNIAALPVARCATQAKPMQHLCLGLIAVRRAELTDSADDAHHADQLIQRLLLDQPRSAVAWYALGIVRLQLARVHALAREGPLQGVGVSNETGAGYALVHALELDATLRPASEALALAALPPPREGASRLGERVAMLRRVQGMLSPQALYGAGRVELEGGNADSAAGDFRLALRHGNLDSGTVDLSLAQAEYKGGHPDSGRAAMLRGASDTATGARAQYREQVSWVATPEELAAWDSLPAATRPAWLADFWARRDVAEGHADGARLIEHFRRYEYALKEYRFMAPETGRQRNAQNEDDFSGEMANAIRQSQHTGAVSKQDEPVIEDANAKIQAFDASNQLYGDANPFRFLAMSQDILDDRGVVYMRHGKPDEVATSLGGSAAMEIWVYHLPTGPLTLQFANRDFSNSTGATVLVPTLVTGNAEARDRICYLDTSLCPRAVTIPRGFRPATLSTLVEVESGQLATARIKQDYLRGVDEIHQATTTDDFVNHFARAMHPAVQMLALPRLSHGSGLIIPFAIPGDQLDSTESAGTRTVYVVRFQASLEEQGTGRHFEVDTTRRFATAAPLRAGQFLTGYVELPAPAGHYRASLVIRQPTDRGAVASLDDIVIPASTALAVSDLVLGRDDSGVHWNSGAGAVSLNPLGTYPVGGSATVYYQLAGLAPGIAYQSTFDVFRADDGPKHAPRLAITSSQVASQATADASRALGLQHLEPGRYRVVLTVEGGSAKASAQGWLTIVK